MGGEARHKLNDKQMTYLIAGGVIVLAILYIASEEAGHPVPATEKDTFSGVDNAGNPGSGTMLDLSPLIHGWHAGYDPVPGAQKVATMRHRYPRHCGQNLTVVMTKGFDPLCFCAPDSAWATSPPSEVNM
jgi:hypothetical protein